MNKKIACLTSGGDAPGMNSALRALVRILCSRGDSVFGVLEGYKGLIDGEYRPLGPRDVSNTVHLGGTILHTSREERMQTEKGLQTAASFLHEKNIDALMVLGGEGSFKGALALAEYYKGKIIGIPCTIDCDVPFCDKTIGFDTAVNCAMQCIDRIRDTAEAGKRFFLIEVMGRECGMLALYTACASGAEEVIVPEIKTDYQSIVERLEEGIRKGKKSSIIVVAEGAEPNGVYDVSERITSLTSKQNRIAVLGHLLRGGSPSAFDRILGEQLASLAVSLLENKEACSMATVYEGSFQGVSMKKVASEKRGLTPSLIALGRQLAT